MANNNEYPNQVPSAKQERLMPRFLKGAPSNGTTNEIAVKGPKGLKVRATGAGAGCVYPDEGGRYGRIGLPDRFKKG
jgi:hypothetical protein